MRITIPQRVKSRALGPVTPSAARQTNAAHKAVQKSADTGQRNVVELYLRAFGVSDLSLKTLPSCINSEFAPEWAAFLRTNQELKGEPAGRALRAVLSFLTYCRELKINPISDYFVYRDPMGLSSKIDPNRIRRAVVEYEMRILARKVAALFRRNRLVTFFKITKTKAETGSVRGTPVLVCNYVLAPKNARSSLDAILPLLEGTLYDRTIPPQLKAVTQYGKDASPDATKLFRTSTFGWHILYQSAFGLYMKRAKGGHLVVRMVVDLSHLSADNGDLPARDYLRAWNKTKKPI